MSHQSASIGNPSSLYRWEKQFSKPKPKKKEPTLKTDDIESWMARVEFATTQATETILQPKKKPHSLIRSEINEAVGTVLKDDATHDEAQQLLSEWFTDSVVEGKDPGLGIWSDEEVDPDSNAGMSSIQSIIQQTEAGNISMEEYNKLMQIDTYDENREVASVLESLHQKTLVSKDFFSDLGEFNGLPNTAKKIKNPVVKMEARQKQVKEGRDKKREIFLEKQKKEKEKREAQQAAKHKAAQERIEAQKKQQREEMEIQKEMLRIRKELQEDRKEQLRKQEEERELRARIERVEREQRYEREHTTPRTQINDKMTSRSTVGDNEVRSTELQRKRKLLESAEIAEKMFLVHSRRMKQRYFSQWYEVILENRLKMGKARAVADLKLIFSAWKSWRRFVRNKEMDEAARFHQQAVLHEKMKLTRADEHYRRRLLDKCFLRWKFHVASQDQVKGLLTDRDKMGEKMSAFLSRVANKNDNRKTEKLNDEEPSSPVPVTSAQSTEISGHIDNYKPVPQPRKKTSQYAILEHHTKREVVKSYIAVPTLRRRHSEEDFMTDHTEVPTGRTASNRVSTVRSSSANVVPKNFENRFSAQQKILKEQSKALKEQQKMIEDLKFNQNKKLLEEQLKQQENIQKQLEQLTKLALRNPKQVDKQTSEELNLVLPVEPEHQMQDGSGTVLTQRTEQSTNQQTARTMSSSVNPQHQDFTKRLEERAAERQKMKGEREAKRRQREEERFARIEAEEAERRKLELEEKQRELEKYKEKRRLEKQRDLEKQQLKEKLISDLKRADDHSDLRCMKYYGFIQLKNHALKCRENRQTAKRSHQHYILRTCLSAWRDKYTKIIEEKQNHADKLYHRHLLKQCFHNWAKWGRQQEIMCNKADRHFSAVTLYKTFNAWLNQTTKEKVQYWEKERLARQHDNLRMKKWVIRELKQLPVENARLKEREEQIKKMKEKVSSLLPDFGL